jgi:hypothetical protein
MLNYQRVTILLRTTDLFKLSRLDMDDNYGD